MTFRHVLSHTGGLSYGLTRHPVDRAYAEPGVARERGETLRTFVEKLAHVPLRYSPGERWMYSLSTDVCGYLVEAISGQRFDQYLQEHDLRPARHGGHFVLGRAGEGAAVRGELPAAARQDAEADRRPGEEHLPQDADVLLGRWRTDQHDRRLLPLLRDAAAGRRARRRAHPRPADDRADDEEPPRRWRAT